VLQSSPMARAVRLNSPGGRIAEAQRISERIGRAGLDTMAQGECQSACTIILLSGRNRSAMRGTRVGFHQSTIAGNNKLDDYMMTESVRDLFKEAGVKRDFLDRAFSTASTDMWYPSEQEMLDANFLTTPSLVRELDEAAREASTKLPVRLDELTVLARIVADGTVLRYRYKVSLNAEEIDRPVFERNMRSRLRQQSCSDPSMTRYIGEGASLVFNYSDARGRDLGSVVVDSC
jgi:hypothetical protein